MARKLKMLFFYLKGNVETCQICLDSITNLIPFPGLGFPGDASGKEAA